ncbi:hypothetical protein BDV38DRAFT_282740 [Aspergillus pseudotamarii]|uniref:Aerobactin siderophore biosynthesis IucA/IucC-like C-terminal domain-containing protein n=1 Tax=Aspergillus pseudotamarii TaxID=132259 RepID=A0A5N6SVF0_ASPPS|nr:uncharacterized protein BDV38DRAFT_282740 [Aspergillus pseudotamarii]KAE8137809.1 hypothetical protein BDV38DRAFT_282740 [Aspergillus pseudotamarii]
MRKPSLAFVSVPRVDMRVSGQFEGLLDPLLSKLEVFRSKGSDRVAVPCLAQQVPMVLKCFPNAVLIKQISNEADAQASMRSVTMIPELGFKFRMELSFACHITSAVCTITRGTAVQGPWITSLLYKPTPTDVWVFGEVASICGSQEDFSQAKNMSSVLREDLEQKASLQNEALIVAAALLEQHPTDGRTYAEILFNLTTVAEKTAWLGEYFTRFFALMLQPLVRYEIALDAHMQNVVVRICTETGYIKGFAIRDVKFHKPTLLKKGFNVDWEVEGSLTLTDEIISVWSIASHTIVQSHIAGDIYPMQLEAQGGWGVAREALTEMLAKDSSKTAKLLLKYFLKGTVALKCFFRMIVEGVYRYMSTGP